MAATNYTPIQLYYSTTASAAPVAGNLANGELAINITDGKLYYKDNGGVVQVIATKGAGTIGGSNTQIQYNNSGALAGSSAMTFNSGTNTVTLTTLNLTNALGATYGGTAQSSYTQGDILYSSATNTLSKLGIGTVNYILTSTGSVPQWVAPTSVTVQTANNLAGGAGGSVPYQSSASTTTFLSIGSANTVMTSSGSAPQWVTSLTGLTGVSSSSITNTSLTSGRLVYSTTGGAQTDSSSLTFNGTTLSAGGFSTTGLTTLVKTVTIGNSNFDGSAVFAAATPAKLYIGTGTVTDTTSAIGATNAVGAISSLAITPIAATNTSVTYTNASTLYIAGAPSAGTNVTITNPYALYVAAGASYFGGGVTYGGNLTVTGNLSVNGNTTLGDAAADNVTVNGTITSNLIFTDNTYDIGASGATRPRSIYLAGNATLGGSSGLILTANGAQVNTTYAGVTNTRLFTDSGGGVISVDGTNNISLRTGGVSGTSVLVVNGSSNYVGIGTSSPQELLHITATTPVFRMQGGSRTFQQYVGGTSFYIRDVTAGTNRTELDASGYFGINTSGSTLNQYLTINGSGGTLAGTAAISLWDGNSGGSRRWCIANGASASGVSQIGVLTFNSGTGSFTADPLTSGFEIMRLTGSPSLNVGQTATTGTVGAGLTDATTTFSSLGYGMLGLTNKSNTANNYTWMTFNESNYNYVGAIGTQNISHNPASGAVYGDLIFATKTNGAGGFPTEKVRITSTGQLLVGTTTTSGGEIARFQTATASGSIGIIAPTNGACYLNFGDTADANVGFIGYEHNSNYMNFRTNSSEAMRINSSGNVGIGTTSISYRLDVVGASNTTPTRIQLSDPDGRQIAMSNPTTTNDAWIGTPTNHSMYLRVGNSGGSLLYMGFQLFDVERARISQNGYFKASNNGTYESSTGTYNEINGDNYIALVTAGRAASGGTAVSYLRAVTSNAYTYLIQALNGVTATFQVLANGNVQNANNSYGSTSDIKVKENIVDASPKLADLMQVKVRNYNLKTDPEHKQIGVIAQELEQVFPGMVEESPDKDSEGNDLGTTTKSVKYSVFVPMLIKAMQEQQAIIESLKARLDAANL